ncbi:hypothetical protein FD755_012162, partial [Muntiacus reevesi]
VNIKNNRKSNDPIEKWAKFIHRFKDNANYQHAYEKIILEWVAISFSKEIYYYLTTIRMATVLKRISIGEDAEILELLCTIGRIIKWFYCDPQKGFGIVSKAERDLYGSLNILWHCLSLGILKNQRYYFANKGPSSQGYGFSRSHVWMLYRPFYLQLTNMPFINYSIQKPSSPFDVEKPSSTQKQTQVKLRIQTDGDKCGGIPVQFQLKEKKKKGYCECCLQKYEDLDIHLLSEQHRNFAQSNHYQVVDDIVSKLVFDFVEYERDTPKKKRIKYSVGSLSPIFATVVKRSGTKEELKLLHNFQKDFRGNVHMIEQGFLYKEPLQEPEQKSVSTSEHTLHHSSEPRELDDKTSHKCSMLNPAENDIKQNFTPLPPCKNKQECILDVSEHKLILNESDLEVKVGNCPCRPQTSIQVSNFNTDDSASQRKQKSDTMLFPAKDLKEKDLYSVYHCDSDVLAINSSQEHLTIWAEIPSQSPPEEPNTCDIKSMDSLPSGKICRKVKIPLRRNKKENLEPNVGLDKKRTEFLTTQEENRICSSPVQSLLDLFQTSEEKSEFLGFTSYTDNNNICDVLDIWEEENSNLLTMFFSSPSTSTFTGF